MRISDWSSDVCSSDLCQQGQGANGFADQCKFSLGPGLVQATRHQAFSLQKRFDAAPGQNADAQVSGHHAAQAVETGRSEEHTSELQSLMRISYAVFCLKQKKKTHKITPYDSII